jgi:hypothetical protein
LRHSQTIRNRFTLLGAQLGAQLNTIFKHDRKHRAALKTIIIFACLLGLNAKLTLAQNTASQPNSPSTTLEPASEPVSQPSPNDLPAKIERRAILEFKYEPKDGVLEANALTPNGADPFPLEQFTVFAIGERPEQGRSEPTKVERLSDSGYRSQLRLSRDVGWNVQFEVLAGGERLTGSYLLSEAQATVGGRVALVRPPTQEISRLSLITSLLVGIPLTITALVVLLTVVRRAQLAKLEP